MIQRIVFIFILICVGTIPSNAASLSMELIAEVSNYDSRQRTRTFPSAEEAFNKLVSPKHPSALFNSYMSEIKDLARRNFWYWEDSGRAYLTWQSILLGAYSEIGKEEYKTALCHFLLLHEVAGFKKFIPNIQICARNLQAGEIKSISDDLSKMSMEA